MDSIIFSFNAVFPLVILILLGFILKQQKLGLFKEANDSKTFFGYADKLVFNLALPVYIFNEIYGARVDKIFDWKLVVFCVSGIIISFLLLIFITPFFIKKKTSRGAFIQGIYRSNFAILGVPLAGNLFGDSGASTAALVIPFAIPLFNVLAVAILTINSDNSENPANPGNPGGAQTPRSKNNALKIITGVIKNPLIISIIVALPFMLFKIGLPPVIQKSVSYIANMSTPLALISLGAGIDLRILKNNLLLPVAASLLRTVALPAAVVAAAVLLGFRDAGLVAVFVLFAAPTAVSSYIMAKNMNSDYELAGQIVALTTAVCPVTVFIGSFALKSFGLI